MFRLSPRRSQRSKVFKVKHALQLCVLLGVCIWLIYQLKHSNEKKSSYVESTKTTSEVVKFGRKDLHPRAEETSVVDARHKEEDEEEEQQENKQEEQHKLDDVNGVQDEVLKHEQNDNEENSEHRQDSVDQETEENSEKSGTKRGTRSFYLFSNEERTTTWEATRGVNIRIGGMQKNHKGRDSNHMIIQG